MLSETVDRSQLWRVQTPQAFHFDAILDAHRSWTGEEPTDDARMLMAMDGKVRIVPGSERLSKFTFSTDFAGNDMTPTIRSGIGFDVHRLYHFLQNQSKM